jgi:DNA repair protein RadD
MKNNGTFWGKIAYQIETAELIRDGYLCPIQYYSEPTNTDELVVNSTGADFTTESLERFWNDKRLRRIAQAVQFSHENHKRTLIFCSSIKQAKNAQALVEGLGVHAEMVDGKTPKAERERIIEDFKTGKVKHLFNVGVFTTGFDMPVLDCIVLARPTMSLALYYQMVGRGVRLDPETPGKMLHVYDLAGLCERLGRVESIRVTTEPGGFKNMVVSEIDRMDECALFRFLVKKQPNHLRA